MTTTSAPATRFLARPEGRIAYDVSGPDDAPLVVAVPGMVDVRATWRFTVPALLTAGFRVATMDLRGHGESDTTFTAHDDVAAAGDVVALVEALAPTGGRALLLGSSMGAAAAAYVAADRPGLVAGIALTGPFVRGGDLPLAARLGRDLALARPWGPAFWAWWQRRLFPGRRPDDLREYQAAARAALTRPGAWRAVQATTRTSHAPVGARLGEVRCPVLVVMGTADPDWKDAAQEAREIAAILSARLVLVDGAGHYPHAERPDVVTPEVVAFARETLGA